MEREVVNLLETAAMLIWHGETPNAAWRVADAGLLLRETLEADKHTCLIGLDQITGRGAALPRRQILSPSEDAAMDVLDSALNIVRPANP